MSDLLENPIVRGRGEEVCSLIHTHSLSSVRFPRFYGGDSLDNLEC